MRLSIVSFFCVLLLLAVVTSSLSPVEAVKINHRKIFPNYPQKVYPLSLHDDSRNGSIRITNAHFDNDTIVYIQVDVHNGHIHFENCTIASLIIHNTEPEYPDLHKDIPAGVTYFLHADLKHEQPRELWLSRKTAGNKLHFKVVNCTVEYGIKFTGEVYYTGGSFRIVRYHGGPVVFPRIVSNSTLHSPLLAIQNSTVHYRSLPSFREDGDEFQLDDWITSDVIRYAHFTMDDHIQHPNSHLDNIMPPTVIISGCKIFGGVIYVTSEGNRPSYAQDVIVKNNILLDGASINFYRSLNTSKHGHVDVSGNRFYGVVDPVYAPTGVKIQVGYTPHLLVNNNFCDWKFPLVGNQVSHREGANMQHGFEIAGAVSDRIEFKNNVILIRKAERFFEAAVKLEDGFHVEATNNEIFVNRTRRHIYQISNWRFNLVNPDVYGLRIRESSEFGMFQHMGGKRQIRHVLVDGNTVHIRAISSPQPPRSKWHSQSEHEKLDDTTPLDEVAKIRKKRRDRLRKYHKQIIDDRTASTRDGYLNFMKAAYQDPEHERESPTGDFFALRFRASIPSHVIINNNTFHVWSGYRNAELSGIELHMNDDTEKSWVDIIGNRVSLETNHSGSAIHVYTLTNASHTIVRENEVYCRMAHGDCVMLSAQERAKPGVTDDVYYENAGSGPYTQVKKKHKKLSELDLENEVGFRGITFRRNKVRFMAHAQHVNRGGATALHIVGAVNGDDVSVFIQDNDIRARGISSLIKTQLPRIICENNVLKTQGHIGVGFYDIMHSKYLYIHHDQLERAPLPPHLLEAWHQQTLAHKEHEALVDHKGLHPVKRKCPKHAQERKEHEEKLQNEVKPHLDAFMEAQKQHSKSLYAEHIVAHEEEIELTNHKGEKLKRKVQKIVKKFTPSQSKYEHESVGNLPSSSNNNNNQKSASRSFSQSEIEQAQSAGESLEDSSFNKNRLPAPSTPNGIMKEIQLSPVFANNITFPIRDMNHHRYFSLQCITVNGQPLDYAEVKPWLPYKGMDLSELKEPHMAGVMESEDEVHFGCPELERGSGTVPKVRGGAHEDL